MRGFGNRKDATCKGWVWLTLASNTSISILKVELSDQDPVVEALSTVRRSLLCPASAYDALLSGSGVVRSHNQRFLFSHREG